MINCLRIVAPSVGIVHNAEATQNDKGIARNFVKEAKRQAARQAGPDSAERQTDGQTD